MKHQYYAHSSDNEEKSAWHLLSDHLLDTAKTAAAFARRFGAEELAYAAGLLHDLGKYTDDFQRRLQGENIRVNHSSAGALEVLAIHKALGKLLAYVIAGHHCGLMDWGSNADESSLAGRLVRRNSVKDYSAYKNEIELPQLKEIPSPLKNSPAGRGFSAQFFVRFLYSALVDADFLDTERALQLERAQLRAYFPVLADLEPYLADALTQLNASAGDTPVNRKRREVLDLCREKAANAPGFFTLTVPTGGGKTLSSLAFALQHALKHDMERIIYVIPYTSIIEQNAAVFKEIFGEEVVLEHHSNFTYPENDAGEEEQEYSATALEKLKLASENWDLPLVATTNVQFFESLFAANSSRCRKLHNIANSVIIIDEAQMIPTGYLHPCINALLELVLNYKASVILSTATQPAINRFIPPELKPVEIMDEPHQLYSALQRVEVQDLGLVDDDYLAENLLKQKQMLCIVNSKKHARLLYESLKEAGAAGVYHLSTRMCPRHRSKTLQQIKDTLQRGEQCRVISTQLVEAGVDLDFPVVYRSIAGIDSIAQAAGRCNRNGRLTKGLVYVFRPEKHGLPAGWLSRTASIGEEILKKHADPLNLQAVQEYFTMLYDIEGEKLDKKNIMGLIREQESSLHFPFRTIADEFKLIDENTTGLVIPWDDRCKKLLRQAVWSDWPGRFARKLQQYTVQVFEGEFREMLSFGIIESVAGTYYMLSEETVQLHYDREMGLMPCTDSMLLKDNLII